MIGSSQMTGSGLREDSTLQTTVATTKSTQKKTHVRARTPGKAFRLLDLHTIARLLTTMSAKGSPPTIAASLPAKGPWFKAAAPANPEDIQPKRK
jgi:hypothetical protein